MNFILETLFASPQRLSHKENTMKTFSYFTHSKLFYRSFFRMCTALEDHLVYAINSVGQSLIHWSPCLY